MPNSGEALSVCLAARKDDDNGDDDDVVVGDRKADAGVTCDSVARRALLKHARTNCRLFPLLLLLLVLVLVVPQAAARRDGMFAGGETSPWSCARCRSTVGKRITVFIQELRGSCDRKRSPHIAGSRASGQVASVQGSLSQARSSLRHAIIHAHGAHAGEYATGPKETGRERPTW